MCYVVIRLGVPETPGNHEAFDGLALSELPIEEVIWSDERARHIRTRRDRKGLGEVDLEPEWATEAALDPHRLVARGSGRSSIQVVGYSPGARRVLLVWIWTKDHPPTGLWHGGSAIAVGRRITSTYKNAKDKR